MGVPTTPDRSEGSAASVDVTDSPASGAEFVAKATDLGSLRDAAVDAAAVGAGLWFSYLFVLLYLTISVGSVTHRDLLLENPIKLPFLSVDLPLLGFFMLAPGLLLIAHAYVLLHVVLLAAKVNAFDRALEAQVANRDSRTRLRGQLPSNIFVQFLAGPQDVRAGIVGFALRLVAQITLIFGPVALLVLFQLQFLPYHHEPISMWQRFAVGTDLLLLWVMWPLIERGDARFLMPRDLWRGKVVAAALASLAAILLVFTTATFPGEWLDRNLPSVPFVPTKWPELKWEQRPGMLPRTSNWLKSMDWTSPHDLLVNGDVDLVRRKRTSLFSNTLVTPGIDVVDHVKFDKPDKFYEVQETVSLRGRDLNGAVLIRAGLQRVDFTGAQLNRANLSGADLRQARFDCEKSTKQCTQLQNATLDSARLEGASLDGANLQGALLWFSKMQGADFSGARLVGADLSSSDLSGASFFAARLEGASLVGSRLLGARLDSANLRAADLSFVIARGAVFDGAELQGTVLYGASLQGASFTNASVWRAILDEALTDLTRAVGANSEKIYSSGIAKKPWTFDNYRELASRFETMELAATIFREVVLFNISSLDPSQPLPEEEQRAAAWAKIRSGGLNDPDYQDARVSALYEAACYGDATPFVIDRLLKRIGAAEEFSRLRHISGAGPKAISLANVLRDASMCPGAEGLTASQKSKLFAFGDVARRTKLPLPPEWQSSSGRQ
jgi:uncharacterized protein YjbI with pentapeptide repeats